jgi:fructokinase
MTKVIESIPISPVDTTGAGDAFVGAVLFQLDEMGATAQTMLDDGNWKKIIVHANKAGARTCMYLGAMEAFRELNRQIFE